MRQKLKAEYAQMLKLVGPKLTPEQRSRLSARFHVRLDEFLDEGRGACYLRLPEIAQCVIDTLRYFDGLRYELLSWCVMPNHVHVIAHIFRGADLARILHSWKSYTGNVANATIGRSGSFWWREYYDHCIRDSDELSRTIRYVIENPAKAGLADWPFVWRAG